MTASIAPDGSPVELYRRLPAADDLAALTEATDAGPPSFAAGMTVLDLGCGAGRLANPLAARGCVVTAVDESPEMLAHVVGCQTMCARIEGLDLGRTFDRVLLAGNLVNVLDDGKRSAFLATSARHIDSDGRVVIQRLDPVWAAMAQPFAAERDAISYTFTDVEADGQVLGGTVRYQGSGFDVTERFRLRVLDDAALDDALAAAGLHLERWLADDQVWAECRRSSTARAATGGHGA